MYQDKIIWVTGATSGIGEACVQAFHDCGARLILSGRNLNKLELLKNKYRVVDTLAFDITDAEEWQRNCQTLKDKKLIPHLVLLNAGTCEYFDWPHFDLAMIERIHQVNFLGNVYGIRSSLDLLKGQRKAQLAVMSSSADHFAFPRSEAYGSSKAALSYFVRSLRADLKDEEVELSLIRPGFVKTPLTAKNDFPMPGAITAEDAAQRIIKALSQHKEEIAFPKRFTLPLALISKCPQWLQNYLSQRMQRT